MGYAERIEVDDSSEIYFNDSLSDNVENNNEIREESEEENTDFL